MSFVSVLGSAFSWLWSGLANLANIFRWFARQSYRLKGLYIATFTAAMKVSYDAVVNGLNDALEHLNTAELTSSFTSSAGDFLAFANAVAPVEEALAIMVAMIHLGATCLIIRGIRSVKMRVFG